MHFGRAPLTQNIWQFLAGHALGKSFGFCAWYRVEVHKIWPPLNQTWRVKGLFSTPSPRPNEISAGPIRPPQTKVAGEVGRVEVHFCPTLPHSSPFSRSWRRRVFVELKTFLEVLSRYNMRTVLSSLLVLVYFHSTRHHHSYCYGVQCVSFSIFNRKSKRSLARSRILSLTTRTLHSPYASRWC